MLPPGDHTYSYVCGPAWECLPAAGCGWAAARAAAPQLRLQGRECCSAPLLGFEHLNIIPLHLHLLLISCFAKASWISIMSYSYSVPLFSWPRNTQSINPCTDPPSCGPAVNKPHRYTPKVSQSPQWNFQHSPMGLILTINFIIALDHLRMLRKLVPQTGGRRHHVPCCYKANKPWTFLGSSQPLSFHTAAGAQTTCSAAAAVEWCSFLSPGTSRERCW